LLPRLPGSSPAYGRDATYRVRLPTALALLSCHAVAAAARWASRHRLASSGLLALLLLLHFAGCAGGPRPIPPETPDTVPRVGFEERGVASWYGPGFDGRRTANGEIYDMEAMTAAHRTLVFGSLVEVHNLDNGRKTKVRINDRGPFIHGRIIDLSKAAAREIGMLGPGTAKVRIRVLDWSNRAPQSPAPRPPARAEANRPAGEQLWYVQAGAFLDAARARSLADRLRRSYDRVSVSTAGEWHRVLLGPYNLRDAADDVAASLLRDGFDVVLRPADG
jgi:peptidoglycan lytic transglycosylase